MTAFLPTCHMTHALPLRHFLVHGSCSISAIAFLTSQLDLQSCQAHRFP